jgi:peptidoglycan/LPS O-acetylase OafA/YrhL
MSADVAASGQRLPSLDGWRAIAITLVMLTHLWATSNFDADGTVVRYWISQGDLGVRIFFVLSGFLITYLLLAEYERTGDISLRNFYARRALRIFPVYFSYLFVLLALSQFGLYHDTLAAWVGSFTFTRNLIGQFHSATGHFWSLAVEEQFYLAWPMALVVLGLPRRRRLGIAILTGVVVVCFVSRLIICDETSLVCRTILRRYSPLMYMDSIAVGCLVAFAVTARIGARSSRVIPRTAAWASAVLLLASTSLIDLKSKMLISAVITVQAFLSATCIVASATATSGLAFWCLNRPIIVKLGLISYSLYVWHLMFLSYFMGDRFTTSPIYDWRVWWLPPLAIACMSFYFFETLILRVKQQFERVGARSARVDRLASEEAG